MTSGFAASGCIVCGCGRSAERIHTIGSDIGSPHRFDVVDVTSEEQVERWAQSILESHGPPDLLINNAAVINPNANLWEISREDFDELMAVNVSGTANVLRSFLPPMVERKTGIVINFSSGWGRTVSARVAPYCASKWAIEGLTLALAEELPSGMAAIALNPGVINTDMLLSCFGEGARMYPHASDWSRLAVPWLLTLGPEHNGQSLTVPES